MLTPCAYIAENMGELFECSPVNGRTRIRTPYLYPDGDVIDVFLTNDGFPATLTDFGDTLGWLWTQTVSNRRTNRQQRLIEDVCMTHGVELFRGMLSVRVNDPSELTEGVSRLSQAALRVSDLWFTFRSQTTATINEEVEEFLIGLEIQFERGERFVGRSGRTWRVDFHTRTPVRSALVNVLSTGSRPSARRMAEHTLATWHDLSNYRLGRESLRFISLFDDELDVWAPEDFGLVEDVSDVAYWSRKDEFAELLVA
jgi:hypothetical protein